MSITRSSPRALVPGEPESFAVVTELNRMQKPNPVDVLDRVAELGYMQRCALGDPAFNNVSVLRIIISMSNEWDLVRTAIRNPHMNDQTLMRMVADPLNQFDWYPRQAAILKINSRRLLRKMSTDEKETKWLRKSAEEQLERTPTLYGRAKVFVAQEYSKLRSFLRNESVARGHTASKHEEATAKRFQNA
jgi:hypothetical protein